ncbi:MAG: hypothetical protein NT062_28585 [Proteobacteria bacterium]|nr:hypothetical protein [Pseudomonadota bacterium]
MVLVLVGTGGLILVVGLVLIVMRTGAETHSNIEMKGVKIAGPTGLVLTALGAGLMVTGFVLQQREPVKSLFLCDCLKGEHRDSSSVIGQAAAA